MRAKSENEKSDSTSLLFTPVLPTIGHPVLEYGEFKTQPHIFWDNSSI